MIYENYLGKIYELVQDQPPDLLQAIADEVLAIIRGNDPDIKKKIDSETLIGGKIDPDAFIDLCNVAKALTDYAIDPEEGLNEVIAINEDEEEEEASEGDIVQEE